MSGPLAKPATNPGLRTDDVLPRLKNVRRSGDGYSACCPAHDDRSASLSIGEGADGKLLLHCFAGCAFEAILAALGLDENDLPRSNVVPIRPTKRLAAPPGEVWQQARAVAADQLRAGKGRALAYLGERLGTEAATRLLEAGCVAFGDGAVHALAGIGGWSGEESIAVPAYGLDGRLVDVQFRLAGAHDFRRIMGVARGVVAIFGGPDGLNDSIGGDLVLPGGLFDFLAARAAGLAAVGLVGEGSAGNVGQAVGEWYRSMLADGGGSPRRIILATDLTRSEDGKLGEPHEAHVEFARALGELPSVQLLRFRVPQHPEAQERADLNDLYLSNPEAVAGMADVAEALLVPAAEAAPPGPPGDTRPRIVMRDRLAEVADEAEQALVDAGTALYVRAGTLVSVKRDDVHVPRGIVRPPKLPAIVPVTQPYLREQVDRAAEWVRPKSVRGKTAKPVLVPRWVAETLLARTAWPFPALEAVIEAPTLRPDGTLLDRPGYDAATGILYEPLADFPPVPEAPSREDAKAAFDRLLDLLVDFPWVADSDASAALAAILTVVARHAILGPTPLFAVTAPTPGSGKTLLTDVIAIIGTGVPAARFVYPYDDDETRKRLLAVGMLGLPVLLIDNVAVELRSASLAAAITAYPTYADRLLGQTQILEVPLRPVWLATGNNLAFRDDLGRRVIPIGLDPGVEHPEDREVFHHVNLLDHVRRERPGLLVAALTVLRAYQVAGRPPHREPRKGSFEAWDDLVRGALLWMGLPDPRAGEARIRDEGDLDLDGLRVALRAWKNVIGEVSVTLAEAVKSAEENAELRSALLAFAPARKGDGLDTRTLGYAIRRCVGRVAGGLKFARDGQGHGNTTRWRVTWEART